MDILIGVIIILISGFIQGLTSFGFALIAIPVLAKIIPLNEAVPIVVCLSIFTNILIVLNSLKEVKINKIWLLIIFGIIFTPIGTYSLLFLKSDYLKLILGIIMILFSMLLILNKSFPIKNEKIGYTLTGSLSGFLSGSLGSGGPPVVLFLSNQGMSKESFRANIAFYFIIINLMVIITYLSNGLINKIVINKAIYFVPAMLIGVIVGIKLSKKINELLFKRIVLVFLILSGIWTIIDAVKNIIAYIRG